MADPWTPAWEEAEATAPPGVTIFCTLELQHPAFLDGDPPLEVPIRIVSGVDQDTDFGIEIGARFNEGETVTFKAVPFYSERPEFAEGKTPEAQVVIDGIGREVLGHLDAAVQIKADLAVIYREYRSDDTTEPAYGPIRFVMRKVRLNGTSVIGTAKLDDLANRRFPFRNYTVAQFPGLVTG